MTRPNEPAAPSTRKMRHLARALRLTVTQFLTNTWRGARVDGAATLYGGLFQHNMGGGPYASSTLRLTRTQFISKTTNDHVSPGGGASVRGAAIRNGGLFENNTSRGNVGGGLYSFSRPAPTGPQFLSNAANVAATEPRCSPEKAVTLTTLSKQFGGCVPPVNGQRIRLKPRSPLRLWEASCGKDDACALYGFHGHPARRTDVRRVRRASGERRRIRA